MTPPGAPGIDRVTCCGWFRRIVDRSTGEVGDRSNGFGEWHHVGGVVGAAIVELDYRAVECGGVYEPEAGGVDVRGEQGSTAA